MTEFEKIIEILNKNLTPTSKILVNEGYLGVSFEEIITALHFILSNKDLSDGEKLKYLQNPWKIWYHTRPPTVDEFLTPKWIGVIADKIYSHVKEEFKRYMTPSKGKRVLALSTCIGWGKFQKLTSKVMTPDGYKTMKDIQVGDIICTPDGNSSKVTHIWPQGEQDLYEITFKDGRKTIAGLDHLWKVTQSCKNSKKENGKRIYQKEFVWHIKTTKEIIESGIYKKNGTAPKWKIPLSKPVYHKEKNHIIPSYTMGVLLGDGCLCKSVLQVTSIDKEIVNRLKKELPKDLKIDSYKDLQFFIKKLSNNVYKNFFIQELKRLNLKGTKSHNKFIPQEYLYDSIENRISLLQGLMDTDGTVDKNGRIRYDTISENLQKGIIQLVRSLGGIATPSIQKKNNKKYQNSTFYVVFIQFPDNNFSVFSLKRKQKRVDQNFNRKRFRKGTQTLSIVDIKKINSSEAKCITVAHSEGLYLTDDYIVTHNSTLSTLIAAYIIIHLSYMINPKKFFGLNEMGSIVIALMSFTQKKVNQLLLQPFYGILRTSPMFVKVRQESNIDTRQKEVKKGQIVYTSAGRMGAFQFYGDMHITIASDRNDLLGLNIILGLVSEISFWIQKGVSVEEIWGAFSDMRERVNSRFAHRFLSGVILDSSPLDLSRSPIDKWLYTGEAKNDPEVLIINAKHWEIFPERYPKWNKTKEFIPVFRGTAQRPPKVISRSEIEEYSKDDIIKFPIDLEQSLKNPIELKKIVADLAGWPAGGLTKLIDNVDHVNKIFTDKLKNIYTSINVPHTENPEKMIWNMIKDKFFIETKGNYYEFYRAPKAHRTLHMDLSESGDMASLGMNHLEMHNKTGQNIIVNDFTLSISPEKSKINLDAIGNFIVDLKKLGHINFYLVTGDQYQSSAILQRVNRFDIDTRKLSVDRDTIPYRVVISWILNNRVRVGKNIFLKNNLLSLIETQTDKKKIKIDHTNGQIVYKDSGDWKLSQMGVNAKDVSDGFTGSAYILISELGESIPAYQWNDDVHEIDEYDSVLEKISSKTNLILDK